MEILVGACDTRSLPFFRYGLTITPKERPVLHQAERGCHTAVIYHTSGEMRGWCSLSIVGHSSCGCVEGMLCSLPTFSPATLAFDSRVVSPDYAPPLMMCKTVKLTYYPVGRPQKKLGVWESDWLPCWVAVDAIVVRAAIRHSFATTTHRDAIIQPISAANPAPSMCSRASRPPFLCPTRERIWPQDCLFLALRYEPIVCTEHVPTKGKKGKL